MLRNYTTESQSNTG